jgi:Mor family transcriptional regulator
MKGFVTQFHEYQTQIEFVLVAQMAGNQTRMVDNLRDIQKGIATLIDHVDVPATENEKKAWEYIKTHGVEVLEVETCNMKAAILSAEY